MNLDRSFWKNKKVLLTGHTGFKGGWLSVILSHLNAKVFGYSLEAEEQSFFNRTNLKSLINHYEGDIRNLDEFMEYERAIKPEILIHLAAQPLVIKSYKDPIETFSTNVMGTVNILEAIRKSCSIKSGVIITTDKCYENANIKRGYRENDPMGGHDPYSSSKGAAELAIASYQKSFFSKELYKEIGIAIGSVRAGNIIGGGDWSNNRLIPDLIRAATSNKIAQIRNPSATRPWQHVLEPLSGYLFVAQKLFEEGPSGSDNWNFGPTMKDIEPVSKVADLFCKSWGEGLSWKQEKNISLHEAENLSLDITKARKKLGWVPKWRLNYAIDKVVGWHRKEMQNKDVLGETLNQIKEYFDKN